FIADIGRQSAAILSGDSKPHLANWFEPHSSSQGVALILADEKSARICQVVCCIAAQEEPARNRSSSNSDLIRVAHGTRDVAPLRQLKANLFASDGCLTECNRETYASIEQHVVIGIVPEIPPKDVSIDAQL